MKRAMFGVLAVAVLCTIFTLPAATQNNPKVEVNMYGGRSNASAQGPSFQGTSFPRGTAVGADFEFPVMFPGYFTGGMGLRHESTGVISVGGSSVRISRTYMDLFVARFYPFKQGRVRPYGRFALEAGSNKLHVDGAKYSQSAYMTSVGGGMKIDVSKRWSVIVPEVTLTSGGRYRNPYTGEKKGFGVRTSTIFVGATYCLSCQ